MYRTRREPGFTLVELLVILMIIGALIGMMVPNFVLVRSKAKAAAVLLNMRTVAQAITTFYAENGYYADDFYEDGYGYIFDGGLKNERLGALPINPFTGRRMEPDEFNVDEYDAEQDVTSTSAGGPNDEWGFAPGEMRYATYVPPGHYYPTQWGLIGFEGHGISIRQIDDYGDAVITVLHQ